jgi:hypothetical protein
VSKLIRRQPAQGKSRMATLWWALGVVIVLGAGVLAAAWWRGGPEPMREIAVTVNPQHTTQVSK